MYTSTQASSFSVVLASSSPPSKVVSLSCSRPGNSTLQAPMSLWGINGMGQSRHWPNNSLLLGCRLESKHQLAPRATDSAAHLDLTSMAMKHLYCLLSCFSPSSFRISQKQNDKTRQEQRWMKCRYSGSTTLLLHELHLNNIETILYCFLGIWNISWFE